MTIKIGDKNLDSFILQIFKIWPALVFGLAFLVFIIVDKTPPNYDAGRHFFNTVRYTEAFQGFFLEEGLFGKLKAIKSFVFDYYYYPPFVYYLNTLNYLLFRSYRLVLSFNAIWIGVLVFAQYKFLKLQNFGRYSISASLLFVLSSPFIIGQSREYQLDFPNLVMLVCTLWRVEEFYQKESYKNAWWVGLAIAVGALVKWHYLLHVSLILSTYLIRFFWKYYKNNRWSETFDILPKWVLIFITTTFIAGPWYIRNIRKLYKDLFANSAASQGLIEGDPQGLTIESWQYFYRVMSLHYLQLGLFLVLFLGLFLIAFLTFKNRQKARDFLDGKAVFLVSLGIINLVILTWYHLLQSNKDPRYLIYIFPSLIIFVSLGVEYIRAGSLFWTRFIYIMLSSFFLFNLINLTLPLGDRQVLIAEDTPYVTAVVGSSGYTQPRLNSNQWALYDALESAKIAYENGPKDVQSCHQKTWPLSKKPSVYVLGSSTFTHSSDGSFWGMAERYGFSRWGQNPCFLIIEKSRLDTAIERMEKSNLNPGDYELVSSHRDQRGIEFLVYEKRS